MLRLVQQLKEYLKFATLKDDGEVVCYIGNPKNRGKEYHLDGVTNGNGDLLLFLKPKTHYQVYSVNPESEDLIDQMCCFDNFEELAEWTSMMADEENGITPIVDSEDREPDPDLVELEEEIKDLPGELTLEVVGKELNDLSNTMKALVERGRILYWQMDSDESHLATCQILAAEFNLWEILGEGKEQFPTWLSRVVEGIGNDGPEADYI